MFKFWKRWKFEGIVIEEWQNYKSEQNVEALLFGLFVIQCAKNEEKNKIKKATVFFSNLSALKFEIFINSNL